MHPHFQDPAEVWILNGIGDAGLWIDNSRISVDETVDYMLAHKEQARI